MSSRGSRVRVKVIALLALLVALWAFAATVTLRDGLNLLWVSTIESVGTQTGELLSTLQAERRASLVYLSDRGSAQSESLSSLRSRTDEARRVFQASVTNGDVRAAASDALESRFDEALSKLDTLAETRDAIDTRSAGRTEALAAYTGLIDAGFRIYGSMANLDDQELAKQSRTLVSMSQVREVLSQEDALLSGALAAREFSDTDRFHFNQLVGARRYLYAQTSAELPPTDANRYNEFTTGDLYTRLQNMEDRVIRSSRGDPVPFGASQWSSTVSTASQELRELERTAATDLVERATPAAVWVIVRLALAGGLGLLAVVASIVMAVKTARSLGQQLAKLRNAAWELASQRLPSVVDRLRRGEAVDVDTEAPPLRFGGNEFGQVGRAFNAVQQTAIQAAVDQAELRRGVRDVFLSLARRTQVLVHRQLNLLDAMERRESEPEVLDDLFRIDHLATRMRRHAENLIVLSGAAPGRAWRNPVPLVDIVRGAVAEVEDYVRVKLLPIGPAKLAGPAVGDTIHLLAELIENATSFSPPETVVQVGGQPVANGYAVEIEDRGLGMADEDLAAANEQIRNPPEFNLSRTARLGLYVVAQLAERHGVQVQLRGSPYGGTTAIVLIPRELVTTDDDEGGQQGGQRSLPGPGMPAIAAKNGSAGALGRGELRELAEFTDLSGTDLRGGTVAGLTAPMAGPVIRTLPAPRPPQSSGRHASPSGSSGSPALAGPPKREGAGPSLERRTDLTNHRPSPSASTAGSGASGSGDAPELPQRVRQSHLAAPLRDTAPSGAPGGDGGPGTGGPAVRPPEEVRRMMSSYQQGTTQGRRDAERTTPPRPGPVAGPGGPAPDGEVVPPPRSIDPHDELPS